ncbi:MAG: NAD-glutamate dehydrogenase [Xanthomonadales bacterium]|nr:NAD-glutamate dehydrogenase [Xanthomonadales bacterium]
MKVNNEKSKRLLIKKIKTELARQLGAEATNQAALFCDSFFKRVPFTELSHEAPDMIAAMVINQIEFLQKRKKGELSLRVFNPEKERDGWDCQHTVVELSNDDMPFLVDTSSMVMQELNLTVHLTVHPILNVERDKGGKLKSFQPRSTQDSNKESFIHIHLDKQTDPALLGSIETLLKSRLALVRTTVADWQPMKESLERAISEFGKNAPDLPDEVRKECVKFLEWVGDDHFMFVGARTYDIVQKHNMDSLKVVDGTGLGLLREDHKTVLSRPIASARDESRFNPNAPLIVTKANSRSQLHRSGYMDYIGVLRFDKNGKIVGEYRFIGMFTSLAYQERIAETPLIAMKVKSVLENSGLNENRHAWKSLLHILETLPRDEVFQASSTELLSIAMGVLDLQERQTVRLFIRRERFGRFFSCLVYIPRDYWNTENREKIQDILKRALNGVKLDYMIQLSDSALARLHVIIRPKAGAEPQPVVSELEGKIISALRSWNDELTNILIQNHGDETGLKLSRKFGKAFPAAYMEDISPRVGAYDIEKIDLLKDENDLQLSLYRPRVKDAESADKDTGIIRFKIFKKNYSIPLSNVLPMLENMGLHIVSERPYKLKFKNKESIWIQDFDMVYGHGKDLDIEVVRERFQEAFENTWRGITVSDGFNGLILACQLHWRQVKGVRAYSKYLLQTGMPYSQAYMEETLAKHPLMARLLVELFAAMFNPARDSESDHRKELAVKNLRRVFLGLSTLKNCKDRVLLELLDSVVASRRKDRDVQVATLKKVFRLALSRISSIDEDSILFSFYEAIKGTLRTNFYQRTEDGELHEYMSFKLDSSKMPQLPKPLPFREIWVFSSAVEGIHLRGGKVARGGLRWSDRKEDFRTEVLGLMKAQNVKNTIIVPVGAKGGFVVKHLPENGSRDQVMAEVVRCYKIFINGLLDVTDNLDQDKIIPASGLIRYDEDDPYLVVAADKGTATFSDTANEIALERGFWLGDAFASGGSVGYDHKAMAITARGAWEGVKRHFREVGKNIQKEPFSVVGIGDMSGDVFGNGMLLSTQIQLKAAFNHMHIFLDPDPDIKASFKERKRLFKLPRSGWEDYKQELISKGGGIFSRLEKSIPISREVRSWLGTEEKQLAPNELIRLLLKAEVELLWNGGIGTYVKASAEGNAEVGDAQNNWLRINGKELRCKVVGEGGNLGLTQLGRIEYAQAGGRMNTDFIDNSAGVDCSDHEVNIKILLNQVIRAGKLSEDDRNKLLADMTDEIAVLVLRNNYLQTQTISMMETLTGARLGAKQHFITVLESAGILDRDLENLPHDEELTRRRGIGLGMYRPELSVLLSYSKIMLYRQLLDSDVPEDPWLSQELQRYFPTPLQEKYSAYMDGHRLKREIIATQVTNSLVNRMGASFALRMHEDTGATAAEVARAFTVAREIFKARDFWSRIEALDNKAGSKSQIDATLSMWNLLRQTTRWVLNQTGEKLDIRASIERLTPGMEVLGKKISQSLSATEKAQVQEKAEPLITDGIPKTLAIQSASLHFLYPALDVVETAARRKAEVHSVATVFFGLGDRLHLKWLRESVEKLPVAGQWHAHARGSLRDELYSQHRRLAGQVLEAFPKEKDPVKCWVAANSEAVEQISLMLSDMQSLPSMDYATVSVAVRSLEGLLTNSSSK